MQTADSRWFSGVRGLAPLGTLLIPLLAAVVAAQPPLFRRTGCFLPPEATGPMAFGDLDRDGDEDLLSLGGGVFLNDGFGAFVPGWNPSSALAATNDVAILALSDVDGDGAEDAWVSAWDDPVVLWMNGGAGDFHATSGHFPPIPPVIVPGLPSGSTTWEAAAAADLDGDGDIDIVLGATNVWTNALRQIAPEGMPSLGSRVLVRVFGRRGASWRLFASPARADLLVPPFGRLLIDPFLSFEAASGVLGPLGEGGAAFPVPADPAFADQTIWWQGFLLGEQRFTNAAATTVLDG